MHITLIRHFNFLNYFYCRTLLSTMGTLVETDIDQFIKSRKAKLQEERRHLNEFSVSCFIFNLTLVRKKENNTKDSAFFTRFNQS